MSVRRPFNFQKWIDENRELLKPPVGNKCIYPESEDFIIMVVGGPNIRKDYHYNETEEFYYQIKGDIVVGIQEDGEAVEVPIKEGEIFLLPPKVLDFGTNTTVTPVRAPRAKEGQKRKEIYISVPGRPKYFNKQCYCCFCFCGCRFCSSGCCSCCS